MATHRKSFSTTAVPAAPVAPRRVAAYARSNSIGQHQSRQLNVVFASVGCADTRIIHDVLPRLATLSDVSLRVVLDRGFHNRDLVHASAHGRTQVNVGCGSGYGTSKPGGAATDDVQQEAAELCAWAHLLVLAPLDADGLAKMLHGYADTLLLEVLRAWDVSKKILLIPGMSERAWENPMTKKQLSKIRRKLIWVSVLQPLLWSFVDDSRKIASWEAADELVDAVRNQVDLMNIGQDMEVAPATRTSLTSVTPSRAGKATSPLPAELWTMILDFTGDWELSQTLHIYTNIPPPVDWKSHVSPLGPQNYMEALELTILRGNLGDFKNFIATHSVPRWLSKLCIKLIMRFAMTSLLAHLEASHMDLFWPTFGHTFLPDKASSVFGRTDILDFWHTSPSFLTKEYTSEAMDGASKAGLVHVLDWWYNSGLPLKYTEAALEQASSQGHLAVLEWWLQNSRVQPSKLRLDPGKSIYYATQNGHIDVVRWWVGSGVAFAHEDTVAKLASTHDHVALLQLWYELKGSKMIFDNQVLVGATKNSHVAVLEWWKQSGLKVEYKTCDIEEALEDGDEGERGLAVKRWWARNGLNLGVGTSEWMKTKVLNH